MSANGVDMERPRSILLATDLGARSDRALDRAVQLAKDWQSPLVVATVIEAGAGRIDLMALRDPPDWYRGEDPEQVAERQLLEAMSAQGVDAEFRVERGPPGDRLLEVAEAEGCDLVVAGVARHESLGRAVLGSTVDRLARRSPVPVLVVRGRVQGPYRRMLVASDWSASAEHAMRTAMAMFPQSAITVLHGYEVPMAGLMDTTREQMLAAVRDQALADGREFIARCQPPGGVGSVSLVVERGDPSLLMRMYASQYPVDLAVVATHGRSALLDVMLGSVAQRLLEDLPLDTLVVRKPSADAS